MKHTMRMAKLSPKLARRMGLSSNHHARVWCDCMNDGLNAIGTFSARPLRDTMNDPRRLGSWDWLGIVDMRIANSALDLFREHATKEERAA